MSKRATPIAEPFEHGFTTSARPTSRSARVGERARVVAALRVQRRRDRQPGGREEDLRDALVHRERAREHVGADVRDVEHLEQALERAVLADRAVRDGEHDLVAAGAQRIGEERIELEPDDAMARLHERVRDARRRTRG